MRTQLLELIANTVFLLAAVGLGTLVVGTTLAWLVVHYRFPGRSLFEWALVLPLAMPAYVVGFAFLGFFDFAGPLQTLVRHRVGPGSPSIRAGFGGVVAAMTLVFYPYVYLLARSAFTEQGAATLETARSLGCTRLRAFRQITLPMARPALVAGSALAMMEALADFGTVATFGYRTLTEAIYRVWYGMFDRIAATQLASLLLLFALGLVVVERSLRGRARFSQSRRRGQGVTPVALRGARAIAATGSCTCGPGYRLHSPGDPAARVGRASSPWLATRTSLQCHPPPYPRPRCSRRPARGCPGHRACLRPASASVGRRTARHPGGRRRLRAAGLRDRGGCSGTHGLGRPHPRVSDRTRARLSPRALC